MTHYCTACSSEFDDDSMTPPEAERVHCVFCGARIPLRRSDAARARASMVPFSKDYEREEAFALGVINPTGPGFPDTLRQFRVRTSPKLDSLTPHAQGSEPPSAPVPVPRRLRSLSVSLSVGFGVGVAIAFAAVSLRPHDDAPRSTAPAAAAPPALATVMQPAAMPAAANAPLATPAAPPKADAPVAAAARPLPVTAEQDRRWALDRARSEQRQYRISAAERLYRQILARAPHDSEALSGLGELDLLRGTVDLADAHFQEALDANANYIPALIAAADIRWQSGRVEEARQAYLDIVDHYSADLYPPYVALRSAPATTPVCER
jgi:hypothetical protein